MSQLARKPSLKEIGAVYILYIYENPETLPFSGFKKNAFIYDEASKRS